MKTLKCTVCGRTFVCEGTHRKWSDGEPVGDCTGVSCAIPECDPCHAKNHLSRRVLCGTSYVPVKERPRKGKLIGERVIQI